MTNGIKELSNNDKKILDVLSENSRLSLITISQKTGLSRQTVQKTISRLEHKKEIWGYQVIFDEKNGLFELFGAC